MCGFYESCTTKLPSFRGLAITIDTKLLCFPFSLALLSKHILWFHKMIDLWAHFQIQNVKRHFFRSLSSSTHSSGSLFSINWFPQDSALWWWSSFTPSTPRSTLASLHLTSSPVSIWWGFRDQNRKLGILPDSCSIAERKNYSFFFRFSTRSFTTCLCLAMIKMICFQVKFQFEVWVIDLVSGFGARFSNKS